MAVAYLAWEGAKLLTKIREAQRLAIDEVLSLSAATCMQKLSISGNGKPSAPGQPPHRQYGVLIGSIKAGGIGAAKMEDGKMVGYWGSYDNAYAFALETRIGPRPFLRPSADMEYPKLRAIVRARMSR